MTRLEELRVKLQRVHETADICVATATDPKEKADHERWRKGRAEELVAEIAQVEAEIAEAAHPTLASTYRAAHGLPAKGKRGRR